MTPTKHMVLNADRRHGGVVGWAVVRDHLVFVGPTLSQAAAMAGVEVEGLAEGDDIIQGEEYKLSYTGRTARRRVTYVSRGPDSGIPEGYCVMSIEIDDTGSAVVEHDLKAWPKPFAAVYEDRKRFEYRRNDRSFQVGDILLLREWVPPEG